MKKVIIFAIVVILLFVGISILTNKEQSDKSKDNPYGKKDLKTSTINQLDDPNYQNIITPEKLDEMIENKETFTAYYFSPECSHCVKTTPILMPVAKEKNVHVYQFNLLEYEEGWDDYNIDSTPTLIHYEKGQETSRIVGEHTADEFKQWFDAN